MAWNLDGARVAVTGADGFIGRHVLAALEQSGASPVAIVGPGRTAATQARSGDLTDRRFTEQALTDVDGVVHLAARSGGVGTQTDAAVYAVNRMLTTNVFEAVAQANIERVVAASSAVIYRPATEPIRETHPTVAVEEATPYARSKLDDEHAGRRLAQRHGVAVSFGRFGNVIGPLPVGAPPRTTVVYDLIQKARAAKAGATIEVWGDGSAVRSFVHVEDVAAAIVLTYVHGRSGEAYNIDTGEPVTTGDVARRVRDLVAPGIELTFDSTKPTGPAYRVLSIDKITRLGFSPKWSVAEAIEATAVGSGS